MKPGSSLKLFALLCWHLVNDCYISHAQTDALQKYFCIHVLQNRINFFFFKGIPLKNLPKIYPRQDEYITSLAKATKPHTYGGVLSCTTKTMHTYFMCPYSINSTALMCVNWKRKYQSWIWSSVQKAQTSFRYFVSQFVAPAYRLPSKHLVHVVGYFVTNADLCAVLFRLAAANWVFSCNFFVVRQ